MRNLILAACVLLGAARPALAGQIFQNRGLLGCHYQPVMAGCPNDYHRKPMPTIRPPWVKCPPNDYDRKPLPIVGEPRWPSHPDDYDRKPLAVPNSFPSPGTYSCGKQP